MIIIQEVYVQFYRIRILLLDYLMHILLRKKISDTIVAIEISYVKSLYQKKLIAQRSLLSQNLYLSTSQSNILQR